MEQKSEKQENQYKDFFLSINKKGILSEKLKVGHNYTITTDIIIKGAEVKLTDTGDRNLKFTGELDSDVKILGDNGEIIIAKVTNSQSQLLRKQYLNNLQKD